MASKLSDFELGAECVYAGVGNTFNNNTGNLEPMGIESYGVSLLSSDATVVIAKAVCQRPFVNPIGKHPWFGGMWFEYADGQHLIELLLCERVDGCSLDIRFALSNHSTVDEPFIELTEWAVNFMTPDIWPMNGTAAMRAAIPFTSGPAFFAVVRSEIEALRCRWITAFDPPRGPATVDLAWSFLFARTDKQPTLSPGVDDACTSPHGS